MILIVVLFIAGVVLIFAEIFVPGLILGAIGVLLVIASMAYGWSEYPEYGFFIVVGEAVAATASIIFGLYLLATGKGPIKISLDMELKNEEGFRSPDVDPALVGAEGVAHTALRPAGTIMVNEERLNAVSSGTLIDKGSRVTIIQIEGHRVVVEALEDEVGEPA